MVACPEEGSLFYYFEGAQYLQGVGDEGGGAGTENEQTVVGTCSVEGNGDDLLGLVKKAEVSDCGDRSED